MVSAAVGVTLPTAATPASLKSQFLYRQTTCNVKSVPLYTLMRRPETTDLARSHVDNLLDVGQPMRHTSCTRPAAAAPAFSSSIKHTMMARAPKEYPTSDTGRWPWGRCSSVVASSLPVLSARSQASTHTLSRTSNNPNTRDGHVHAARTVLSTVCFSTNDTV